jgi:hypothetical protein
MRSITELILIRLIDIGLSVVMLSIIMLNVVMLSIILPILFVLSAIRLCQHAEYHY